VVVGDMGATIAVVLNAMRLARVRAEPVSPASAP